MSSQILERIQFVPAFAPVDLIDGVNPGDWVSLRHYSRILCLFHSAVGTATEDPTITLSQATDVAGAGSKALDFTEIQVKQAAVDLAAVGQWVTVTQALGNTYTEGTSAEQEALWGIEFRAEDLDVANGFDCVQLSCDDPGAAEQLGVAYYILADPAYPQAPATMRSAIVEA